MLDKEKQKHNPSGGTVIQSWICFITRFDSVEDGGEAGWGNTAVSSRAEVERSDCSVYVKLKNQNFSRFLSKKLQNGV